MKGLVDCNNFFVSCERTVNRSLEGKAVVVLSNNDGCIVARSNEAKEMGIRMGQPMFEVRDLINSGKLIALSGNHTLYHDISSKCHSIFARYTPHAINYSVDESFLDFSGIPVERLCEIGKHLVAACKHEVGIPVTVGIAPTNTLCKLATEICKDRRQSVGLFMSPEEAIPYMQTLPANKLWGIGRRLGKRLYSEGIYTALQLMDKDRGWIRSKLGVTGERLWCELHGQPCIELSYKERETQDMISETRTFPTDYYDYERIRSRIADFCEHTASRLREMKARCGKITVILRSNRFRTDNNYFAPSASIIPAIPVDSTAAITEAAIDILDRIYNPAIGIKRAGVFLENLCYADAVTPSLFDHVKQESRAKSIISKTIDSINARYPHTCKCGAGS